MSGLRDTLRNGTWLTRQRVRLWALAVLIASGAGLAYLLATATGLNDYQGRPLGTDFSNVYAAGSYVLEGRAADAFDPALQHAREKAIFGPATPFYGWHYPPFFLFLAGALALLPYGLALLAWQGTTLLLYLAAIRAITSPLTRTFRPLGLLLALAYPAVFINLGHGHNGFLTAALMGAGLVLLDRRPVLSGILFGLLAYKPQFGLMIPLVLAATGRWRTFAAAGATVLALAAAATLAFGTEIWRAFLTSTEFTRLVVLEAGGTGWHKIQSVFSWARAWGSPVGLAYAIQFAVTLALAVMLVWLWRSAAAFRLKAAALCIAAILATPYSLDYDMMVLAPAIAFLAVDGLTRGFKPWEASALAALWLVPLVTRTVAEYTLIPLGVIAMLAVTLLILRRAVSDLAAPHGLSQAA
jgi:hypothetical protein